MHTPVLTRPASAHPPCADAPRTHRAAARAPRPDQVRPAGGVALTSLPCRVNDPDLWFAEAPADVEAAKALCASCPLRGVCLDGALERGEPWGVWGGQLLVDGGVVAAKRPRGRPRKHPVAP